MSNRTEKEFIKMKEDYREITPPEGGLESLEETIQKAKKAKQKKKRITIIRNIGLGMAAAFAAVIILANTNEQIAYAMERVPVLGQVIKVTVKDRYEVDTDTYHAEIVTPQAEGYDVTTEIDEATGDINIEIREDTKRLIEKCQKDIENDTKMKSVDTNYEVLTDNEDWFALKYTITETQASAAETEKYYNIDRSTGKMVKSLKEMFQEDSDYITPISENIKGQMRAQMKEDENKIYFLDSDPELAGDDFDKIKEDQNFYINENGNLVIAFDEYEVAPGYMGTVSFEIPKDVTASILKK